MSAATLSNVRLDVVSTPTERLRAALAGLPKRQLHPGDANQAGREGEEPDGGGHREGTGGVQRVTEGQNCKRRLKDKAVSQRNNAARSRFLEVAHSEIKGCPDSIFPPVM